MSNCCHEDGIGIIRTNDNTRDLMGFFKPYIIKGLSTIGRFINTVSPGDTVSLISFSCSYPDRIRILLIYSNITNRCRFIFIKNGLPGSTRVFRVPNTSRASSDPDFCEIIIQGFDIYYATTLVCRTYVAPVKTFDEVFCIGLSRAAARMTCRACVTSPPKLLSYWRN